ncbi:hypothetical protein HBDW_15540 [Herbaspirillum sp. DW155]|uniref:hypothetical protein n=1 Tax=Herbaspirillum sp. DW155 TaxID=3095609 RepID=UPI00308F23D3|nr:hypothetical protein HBDW_15540 [Herbaspirillum sp. DW155]
MHVLGKAGLALAQGLPVVIFFYGGSWNEGSRKDYALVGEALSSRDFIAPTLDEVSQFIERAPPRTERTP